MGVTGVKLLKAILIVCIITVIAILVFGLIPPVKGTLTENIPGFKELLVESTEFSKDIDSAQNCLGPLEELEHICDNGNCISTTGNPHQPSEIACLIADNIYDDFINLRFCFSFYNKTHDSFGKGINKNTDGIHNSCPA